MPKKIQIKIMARNKPGKEQSMTIEGNIIHSDIDEEYEAKILFNAERTLNEQYPELRFHIFLNE